MKNRYIIQLLALVVVFMLPSLLHAQPGFVDDVSDTPIDGGLTLLVAAGVGYGVKKLREKKQSNQEK